MVSVDGPWRGSGRPCQPLMLSCDPIINGDLGGHCNGLLAIGLDWNHWNGLVAIGMDWDPAHALKL